MIFRDRRHAGQLLAAVLQRFKAAAPVVPALPRGGIPVGSLAAEADETVCTSDEEVGALLAQAGGWVQGAP